jgi:hypothetical protein
MEREIRLDKALRHLINNRVESKELFQYLRSVFTEIPNDKLRDNETTAIIEILKNDELIEVLHEPAGRFGESTNKFYELTITGREFILNKGYVLETYLTEIKDKQDKLPNPDSLLFEFDKEVALVKASAKDTLLLSVAQSGNNGLIYENLEIIYVQSITFPL